MKLNPHEAILHTIYNGAETLSQQLDGIAA